MKLFVFIFMLGTSSISKAESLTQASYSAQEDMATSQMDWEESQTARAKDFDAALKAADYFDNQAPTRAMVIE